jgi:hypothetical protein
MSLSSCPKILPLALLLLLFLSPHDSFGQISTGTLTGKLRDVEGEPVKAALVISSELGFRATVETDVRGAFLLALPYGNYSLRIQNRGASLSSSVLIHINAFQNQEISLIVDNSGKLQIEGGRRENAGIWSAYSQQDPYPESFNFAGIMLSRDPATAEQPLNFAGLGDNRLAWQSQRGFSWTGTDFRLIGMDATDSFQPGRPVIVPNLNSLDEIVARSSFAQTTSAAYGTEVGFFPSQPASSWHGDISTSDTSAALSSTNLPPTADRGIVQQTEQYRWFTRDSIEAGGALAKWADLFLAATGEWASQTIPIANPGNNLDSRMLFADTRLRIQAGPRDQFDLLYSGSRLDLFNWAIPAGLEILSGQRMAPSFVSPYGFQNESEVDRSHFFQAGWSHIAPDGLLGALQSRYQYSLAHLDTTPLNALPQSRVELLSGDVTGAAPLANSATETRQQLNAVWQPTAFHAFRSRHQLVIGADFESSSPTNRFTTPSDMNLITAGGAPDFAVEFNTPAVSRSIIRNSTLTFANQIAVGQTLSFDLGAIADFSRGSLPAQSSPTGTFVPARAIPSRPDLIVWNNISPRAGFAWLVPHADGLVLRATYFRVYMPLAGRYLDFGNPNSLGGTEYRWIDRNADGLFEPGEFGPLLLRFGGPYSSISPSLARPYADEIDVGAEFTPLRALDMRIGLFRRDDLRRIAALNTGVPFLDFTPVSILDPGPDGVFGTFDDQHLTVYQQNPATFGQDHYLLTNPPDLRMLDKGFQAEIRAAWRNLFLSTSFVIEESYGPTNPGDAVFENDSGVGSLYMDPNSLVNASGRPFMDRAYIGKLWGSYRLPWGGIELAVIGNYNDGLVFARQLLVTGLAQGPFVIDATSRGTQLFNPLSGNRAEGVINANIRLARKFQLPVGAFDAALDFLNVANSNYKLQESEITGTSFNLRLPVEIQPARFARIQLRYSF